MKMKSNYYMIIIKMILNRYLDESCKQIEDKDEKLQYLEAKELNKKIFEDNMELFINGKKAKFKYKYNERENKEIKVKFKFKNILTNMSHMFCGCSSLVSIDLSSFNTNKVTNMSNLFYGCSSLKKVIYLHLIQIKLLI